MAKPKPCKQCKTSDGCKRHRRFRCSKCRRVVSWDFGASDSPLCDDCWCKANGLPSETLE